MKHKAKIIGMMATLLILVLAACDQSPAPSGMDEPELATTATSSYTGSAAAVHMELKQNGTVICKVYNTPATTKPVVTNCPNGTYVEQLFDAKVNAGNRSELTRRLFIDGKEVAVVVGGPSSSPAASGTYTGSAAAVHMELKQNGVVKCKIYNTPATTKPVVTNCPNGTYVEQLFDANWKQVGTNKTVVVGPTTNPGTPPNPGEAPLRNPNADFYQFETTASNNLDFSKLTDRLNATPEDDGSSTANNGRAGDGNFRVSCQYSHFSYDDPILKPGQTGAAHLHMFFGKTNTNAFTNKENIAKSGGGTCNGFALNRSAYWTPALLDSRDKAIIPKQILVYYKSTRVPEFGVNRMPQGLQLLGGNIPGSNNVPSATSSNVFWSCGANGAQDKNATKSRKDLTKSGTLAELGSKCRGDEPINATIYFPQCVAKDASGNIRLSSRDSLSHTFRLKNVTDACPASHPVRIPELAILLYYPSLNDLNLTSLADWKLSSDMGAPAGSTLHADWMGGWQDKTMDLWVQNCNRDQRNCTLGQTSTPDHLKRSLNKDNPRYANNCGTDCGNDDWLGPYFVTPPAHQH